MRDPSGEKRHRKHEISVPPQNFTIYTFALACTHLHAMEIHLYSVYIVYVFKCRLKSKSQPLWFLSSTVIYALHLCNKFVAPCKQRFIQLVVDFKPNLTCLCLHRLQGFRVPHSFLKQKWNRHPCTDPKLVSKTLHHPPNRPIHS